MVMSARSRRLSRSRQARRTVNPFEIHKYAHGLVETVPDIIEFVISDKYLDRPNLYPRQATALKVVTLQDHLFSQYDHDVIGEWEQTFKETGTEGISPGIYDRIRICKEQGRPWFREVIGVIGRRGSKGYTGGLVTSYVLWNFMHRPGGPQQYYGIDRDKRLAAIVFAGKKEQARDHQWRDIFNVITGAPCFMPYISRPQTERLTVFAPTDILKQERQLAMGLEMEADLATFEVVPAPSTVMAARGPAAFAFSFDEMAHVINSTSNATAEQVYDSATPALDQFGNDGFIYAPSSPWTKTGKFFELWENAIEMEPSGLPAYPEKVMFQLPSWGLYEDFSEADRIPLRPPTITMIEVDTEVLRKIRNADTGKVEKIRAIETQQVEQAVPGPCFKPLKRAIQAYDDNMRQLERANPDAFAVERRSHWAESLNAYLNAAKVEAMFKPWVHDGKTHAEFIVNHGVLSETYMAHGDPANTNKRFGWSMGHRVWVPELEENGKPKRDGTGMFHVVFDKISCWDPADYEDHTLDYDDVMGDIEVDVKAFVPENVSFDQFNVPATIGRLRKYVAREKLPKHVQVSEVTRTRPLNWRHAELFKAALNMGLVHAPMHENEIGHEGEDGEPVHKVHYASSEGMQELKFLIEKNGAVVPPDTGPVQTKDIYDTICEVTVALIGAQMATFLGQQLGDIGLSGMAGMGTDPGRHTRVEENDTINRIGALTQARKGMRQGDYPSRGMNRRR